MRVLLKSGAIIVVNLGIVPMHIQMDNQMMFDYMLDIFEEKGIRVKEIAAIFPDDYEFEMIN